MLKVYVSSLHKINKKSVAMHLFIVMYLLVHFPLPILQSMLLFCVLPFSHCCAMIEVQEDFNSMPPKTKGTWNGP